MDELLVLDIARDAIFVFLKISSMIIIPGMVVGLIVSLFQALTQIQEVTLTFVPKVIVIVISLILSSGFIGSSLSNFLYNSMEIGLSNP